MQSSKIDFLTKYNNLVTSALTSAKDFHNDLCDFLVDEYDLEGVLLLNIGDKEFELLGKSNSSRKTYKHGTSLKCNVCSHFQNKSTDTQFETSKDCDITVSDVVMYEGCLYITVSESERIMLKVAKRTPFAQNDSDDLVIIGNTLRNILRLSIEKKGGFSNSLGDIILSIAHELRTPTNSILGFASLLNEEVLSHAQGEYVDTLKDNAYDLLSILNDLIDIAKLDSGQSVSTLTVIKTRQFVNDIITQFNAKIDKGKIDFIVNIDDELPDSIQIDSQKLRYILINIISNAVRLTDEGKVTLSAISVEPDKINFRITDTSPGIPSDKIDSVYNPFSLNDLVLQRVGNTTGLGLTLVKRYVEFLNGEIEITSTLGKGTSYFISVPIKKISEIETQISALPKSSKINKVLIIEDDYATSKLLSNYIQKWGYEPSIVNSAQQTLRVVEKENYLAILMDINLPDSNGLELLQKLRELPNTRRTPIIVCSVEAEQQKAFLLGAVEYFVKPINYKYLVEVLTHYKLRKDSKILVVDDDIPTLNLLKESIEQAGFNPVTESHSPTCSLI
jgi:signal transduction histidine kinase/ActR/RegA family two-component response regulator